MVELLGFLLIFILLEKTKKWFMQNLLTGRIRIKVNKR